MDVKQGRDPRELVIRLSARDAAQADDAHTLICFDECPDGYRWTKYSVSRRQGHGLRCSVTVVLKQNDTREHRLTAEEAVARFQHIEEENQ